jgi:prefoldin alpha subunit
MKHWAEDETNMEQEQMQRKAAEISWLKNQAAELEQQMTLVQRGMDELEASMQALASFKDIAQGSLFPLGSGIFAKATLTDANKVLVDIGGRVVVEMTIQDATATLLRRKALIETNVAELRDAYQDTITRLQRLSQEAEQMLREKRQG